MEVVLLFAVEDFKMVALRLSAKPPD